MSPPKVKETSEDKSNSKPNKQEIDKTSEQTKTTPRKLEDERPKDLDKKSESFLENKTSTKEQALTETENSSQKQPNVPKKQEKEHSKTQSPIEQSAIEVKKIFLQTFEFSS